MNIRLPSALPVIKKHLERTLKIKWDKILDDPRKNKSTWSFGYMMQMLGFGILSGTGNLRAVETFTENYNERIPDTTLHDTIIQVDPEPLRKLLGKQVKEALRAHELDSDFPIRIIAVDGKSASISKIKAGEFSQRVEADNNIYYNNRVLRAMYVSSPMKLFLAQREIKGKSSETTEFKPFLDELVEMYGKTKLLEVISIDAGMTSKENADKIEEKKLDYIMALKGPQQTLLSNAEYLFDLMPGPDKITEENLNGKKIIRKLFRCVVPPQYKNGWDHIEEFWKIDQTSIELQGGEVVTETRYFISSILSSKLTDTQVMQAIRMHWGIENNGYWILDSVWKEDDSPFANKALVLITLMRLLLYNIIARLIFRRLRNIKARKMSWATLMTLIASALNHLQFIDTFQNFIYHPFEK